MGGAHAHHAGSSTRTFTAVGVFSEAGGLGEYRITVVFVCVTNQVDGIHPGLKQDRKRSRFQDSQVATPHLKDGNLGGWGSGEERGWCGELNRCPPRESGIAKGRSSAYQPGSSRCSHQSRLAEATGLDQGKIPRTQRARDWRCNRSPRMRDSAMGSMLLRYLIDS